MVTWIERTGLPPVPALRGTWLRAMASLWLAVAAGLLSLLALLPLETQRLDAGRPGDVLWFDGVSDAAAHRGARGRWTSGEGRVRLELPSLGARVRLRLATVDARVPDRLHVLRDGQPFATRDLGLDWTVVELALDPAPSQTTTLTLRSAVSTSAEGSPRGVFIDAVEVTTGGWPRRAGGTWLWLGVVFFAVLAAASIAQPASLAPATSVPPGLRWHLQQRWLPIVTGLAALAAAIVFRAEILGHPGSTIAVAVALAAGTWICRAWPAGSDRIARVAPLLFGAASFLLVAALFAEAWTDGRVLSQADMLYDHTPWSEHRPAGWRPQPRAPFGDVPMFVYPFHLLAVERWRAGEIPLWTPGVGSGVPVLANYQSALFSPFTWLLLLVPLPGATVVLASCRLLVGGIGMFCFLRRIGLSAWASSIGGLAYLLSPVTIVWLEHPLGNVAPWLPWILLAVERAVEGRWFARGALALISGFTFLGGHPHLALYGALLGAAYACASALGRPRPLPRMAGALLAIALGAGVAAVQILPFLEYATQSRTIEMRNAYALNPFVAPVEVLATALVPDFFGHPSHANYAGPLNYLEQLNYAGTSVLVLALVGLATAGRSWRPWFFAGVALACCLAMYGTPLVHHLISAVPLLRSASLVRLAFVAAAATAILAAFGVEALLESRTDVWRRRVTVIAVGSLMLAALTLVALQQGHRAFLARHALADFVTHACAGALAFIAATAGVLVLRVRRGLLRPVTGFVLALVVIVELFGFARGFHPLIDPAEVFPSTPEITQMQADDGIYRVVAAGGGLLPNTALAYGLHDPRWYDGIGVKAYGELLDAAFHWGDSFHAAIRFESPLFDLLNVRYVLGPPGLELPAGRFTKLAGERAVLYRNDRALPRAFLVDRYRVESGSTARRLLRDGGIDYIREILLETAPDAASRPEAAASAIAVGAAVIRRYEAEAVEIHTDAPGRRLLTLTDTWFPGWVAHVDGHEVPILRANVAFRAVAVPAGRHVVTFHYRPRSVRAGAWVSGASLAVIALFGALGIVRRPAPAAELRAA